MGLGYGAKGAESMDGNRIGFVILSATMVVVGAGSDHYKVKPRIACGIAARDYQFRQFSIPVVARSQTSTPLNPSIPQAVIASATIVATAPNSPTAVRTQSTVVQDPVLAGGFVSAASLYPPVQGKIFQFFQPSLLSSDQCVLSEMAATIDSHGHWVISFRADQSRPALIKSGPMLINVPVPNPIRPSIKQTSHILRDLFVLKVRFLASQPGSVRDSLVRNDDPVVFSVDLEPFWVERGMSRKLQFNGIIPAELATRSFDRAERVEIEFSYQLQTGLSGQTF